MPLEAPTRPRVPGSGRAEPPPLRSSVSGGGGRGWVELIRAVDDIEAHLLIGRLHADGVETTTLKDRSMPGSFLYGGHNPWAPVAILVRKIQLDDARVVLAELAFVAPPAAPTTTEASRWKGPVKWWITAIALAIAFTGLGVIQITERCEQTDACHGATPTHSGVAGR